jgi:hypothetical protein
VQTHQELKRLNLEPNQALRLVNRSGSMICADSGSVLIIEENCIHAAVVDAGNCYRLRNSGVAIVRSVKGKAALRLMLSSQ